MPPPLRRPGVRVGLLPLSALEVRVRSSGEVREGWGVVDAGTGLPRAGGLHDPDIFGGPGDRRRWGHVALPVPILHPWLRNVAAACLDVAPRVLAAMLAARGGVAEVAARLADAAAPARWAEAFRLAGGGPARLLLRAIPVIPRGYRPLAAAGGPEAAGELDQLYLAVVAASRRLAELTEMGAPSVLRHDEAVRLQLAVARLLDGGADRGGRPLAGLAPRIAGARGGAELHALVWAAGFAPDPR